MSTCDVHGSAALPQTCQQYRAELACEQAPSPELAPLLALQRSKGWQWCPGCGHLVEKRDGCWHMVCRCGCSFCYGCGHWQVRAAVVPVGHCCMKLAWLKTVWLLRGHTRGVVLLSVADQCWCWCRWCGAACGRGCCMPLLLRAASAH